MILPRWKKILFITIIYIYVHIYIYPIIFNLYQSLTINNKVSLYNYKVLINDDLFILSILNFTIFLIISITITLCMAYYIAIKFINGTKKFSILKVAFFLPTFVPSSAIVLTFERILSFDDTMVELLSLILIFVWKNTGICGVILLAGLTTIPNEIYEAGKLDGASKLISFRYLVFPLMLNSLYIATMYLIIEALTIGRESMLLYGRYPSKGQYMISNYFNDNFDQMNIGKLTSGAMVITLIIFIVVSLLYIYKIYLEEK